MAHALLRRGLTWFVRMPIPEDRWADVGKAMGARRGITRELVRTLRTRDHREAQRRRDPALAALRTEVDEALQAARPRPLTDWTADWQTRALLRRQEAQEGITWVNHYEGGLEIDGRPAHPIMVREMVLETVGDEQDELERRRSPEEARRFAAIASGTGKTIAEATEMWLAEIEGNVRPGTVAGHRAAINKLGAYLASQEGWPSLETTELPAVSRRVAGEFVAARRATDAAATIKREFSAYSGLWRWAVRRGYAETNPWSDQTAGMRVQRPDERAPGQERAYTAAELVKLLQATPDQLAPGGGGYAATFWDVIRLALLTGARASEVMGLTLADVIEDGTAIVVAADGRGKTDAASRIIPLHDLAQRVVRDRIASLPQGAPDAPLWPEVPATGRDQRRSKIIANRYPTLRRRILGESDEVDFHSFRRSFLTAAETAMHARGRLNEALVALLVGHRRGSLALDLYSDWTRLGRRRMDGNLGERLATLRAAVDDTVALGFDATVLKALAETAGARPVMRRVQPAFRRKPTLTEPPRVGRPRR